MFFTDMYRPLARLWECSQSGVQNNKKNLQKRKFLLFCPPDWLHSNRRAKGSFTASFKKPARVISNALLLNLEGDSPGLQVLSNSYVND